MCWTPSSFGLIKWGAGAQEYQRWPKLFLVNHKGRRDGHHFLWHHKKHSADQCELNIYQHAQQWQELCGWDQAKVLRKGGIDLPPHTF
jgi:hypothetical protein